MPNNHVVVQPHQVRRDNLYLLLREFTEEQLATNEAAYAGREGKMSLLVSAGARKMVTLAPSDPGWDRAFAWFVFQLESAIDALKRELIGLDKRLADWISEPQRKT